MAYPVAFSCARRPQRFVSLQLMDRTLHASGAAAAGAAMTQSFNPPTGVTTRAIAHSQADAASLTIPDAQLLFSAEFKRSGSDLTLIGPDGRKFIVFDYFRFEKRPDLVSSDGATLAAQLVEKLSGSVAPDQYAQATPPAGSSAQVIGKVEKVTGSVTAIRNGVAVTLTSAMQSIKTTSFRPGPIRLQASAFWTELHSICLPTHGWR